MPARDHSHVAVPPHLLDVAEPAAHPARGPWLAVLRLPRGRPLELPQQRAQPRGLVLAIGRHRLLLEHGALAWRTTSTAYLTSPPPSSSAVDADARDRHQDLAQEEE